MLAIPGYRMTQVIRKDITPCSIMVNLVTGQA